MIEELKRSYPTARKEHRCMYCGGTINVGEKYERQTNKYDNQIYDWVCHLECQEATGLLGMFDNDYGEGVHGEDFIECLKEWLFDKHYNDETETYDEGFDPDKLSYHDIVLNVIKELKETKQVNYSTKVDGDSYYWISDYSEDSYKGELIDTRYSDGADYTDWCQFVGTEEECQRYIEEKNRRNDL